MSLVGFRAMLVHECDVMRRAVGSASVHAHNTGAFGVYIAGMKCRFMQNPDNDVYEPVEASVKTWRVFCLAGQGIEATDQLVKDGVTYEILTVLEDSGGANEITRLTCQRVAA